MTERKFTKKDYFSMLATTVENASIPVEYKDMLKEFINHEIKLLEKKSEKSGETKRDKENATIMEAIKEELAAVGRPVTITELQSVSVKMAQYSNQKLSALLRKLVLYGDVVKTMEKKVSYFSLANRGE